MFSIQKQISRLYCSSILSNLSLTGAWVAILAARGFSLVEIGLSETVFHIVSLIFEIPSGVLADVLGRKRMLMVSTVMRMIANVIMIFSNGLPTVCLSLAFHALAYNFSSGSGDALAYDALKSVHQEERFERYNANQFIIYRLFSGLSTLCAGFALYVGHQVAYGIDLISGIAQLAVLASLTEFRPDQASSQGLMQRLLGCFRESFAFILRQARVRRLMLCNSLVGAIDTLLLFFLQAKLPERGLTGLWLGMALLLMEMGGILGSRLILHMPKWRYASVFALCTGLVTAGFLMEHSPLIPVMVLGGFLAALGDDALQVRTNARIQDLLPSDQRATLTSIESFTFSTLMIVLSPLAGVVFTYW